MTEDHLESRATKIWTRFTDGGSLGFVRNEQWQSLDWKRWQRSVLRERIASVKAERTRKFTSTSIGVARKIERKKMKIERRPRTWTKRWQRRRTGLLLVDMKSEERQFGQRIG
jgi:hypothetical protein